jgi:hypothetical protein
MFVQFLPTAVAVLTCDYVLSFVESWLRQVSKRVDGIVATKCGGVPPL